MRQVVFWASTFQSDLQTMAYHLARAPGFEVTVALPDPDAWRAEAAAHLWPFEGRIIPRERWSTRRHLARLGADLLVVDNHLPRYRVAPRVLVLWHGFGWRVDDLRGMQRELRRHVGPLTPERLRWSCFGDWDRRDRVERSGLPAPCCLALGPPFADLLRPGSARRETFHPSRAQRFYTIDLSRPTLLMGLTWHHGGVFSAWGDEPTLLARFFAAADDLGANVLWRMHDRKRYDPAYLRRLESILSGFNNVQLKFKSDAPDSLVDLLVSDVMISNYSSLLNTFYYTLRPTIHLDTRRHDTPEVYRRLTRRGVRVETLAGGQTLWKLPPETHGGLRATSFEQLLDHLRLALSDPSCCRERSLRFIAEHINGYDGHIRHRLTRLLRQWLPA